jgi:hypothetical protein
MCVVSGVNASVCILFVRVDVVGIAVVTTLAGSGIPGFANGVGTQAYIWYPVSVAVDASGTVFVADEWNQRIRKISPTGGRSADCFCFSRQTKTWILDLRLVVFDSRTCGGVSWISQLTIPRVCPNASLPRAGRWAARRAWPARPAHSAPPVRATPTPLSCRPSGCALVCRLERLVRRLEPFELHRMHST